MDKELKPGIRAETQLSKHRHLGIFRISSHTQGICRDLVDTTQGFGEEKPFWRRGCLEHLQAAESNP